jgi:hypothetical protein
MIWLTIDATTHAILLQTEGDDDAEAPIAGEGQKVVLAPGNYPATMRWDPTSPPDGGFRDIEPLPLMSVGRFKLLFTRTERIAMRQAAATDDGVADWLDLLDGFTEGVALDDPLLVDAIGDMATAGLLTPARAAAVLAGEAP